MGFINDLTFGTQGEYIAASYYDSIGYQLLWVAPKKSKYKPFDLILFNSSTVKIITVEVKRERYGNDRMAVEIEYNSTPSGVFSSSADFFTYVRPDGIYTIDTSYLTNIVMMNIHDGVKPNQKVKKGIITRFYLIDKSYFTKVA